MKIGVVSDTHGLLRPELLPLLAGSHHILHLGDVGDPEILGKLSAIAPVTAIRGNIDGNSRHGGPCAHLPASEVVTFAGLDFYLLHNLQELDLDPAAAGFAAVLFGHSHKPEIRWKPDRRNGSVLYFNPGSCGPRRFQLPITCGRIEVKADGRLDPTILELPIS